MNKHLQNISDFIQQDKTLSAEQKVAVLKSLKDADKELEITTFKLDRTEKVKRTTAILLEETIEELEQKRKAVEAQNKELEIESSLERVRTVAMGMRKPDDLLDICQTLFTELHTLGFGELRNAMINIFDNDSISFLNYDYSDNAGKTITAHYYDSHPVIEKQVKEIRSSNDAFSETVFSGKDLDEWRTFRKEKGEKDDPKMDNLPALFYYFYSISTGAIGISTYNSITDEKRNVLKRFRNVFDLAYRRFIDIKQAEAQVREAKIEAALEKVRSRSLAMHKSDEIKEVVKTVVERIKELDIEMNGGVSLVTFSPESRDLLHWIWIPEQFDEPLKAYLPWFDNIMFHDCNEGRQKGRELVAKVYSGDDKANYFKHIFNHSGFNAATDDLKAWVMAQEYFGFSFAIQKHSGIFLNDYTGKFFSAETNDILIRFSKVFEQSYIRFLDLQKAEAQAREAKIEAALERTRTQSMIMQHSKELDDTLRVFHEQVLLLGIGSAFSFLWLPDEEKDRHIFWAAWAENNSTIFRSKAINYPLDRNEPATKQCLIDWKSNEPVYSYAVPPEGVKNYFAAWAELIDGVEKLKPEYFAGGLYYVEAFMKYGCFGVMISVDLTDDEKKILSRFAIEFERTYTRFLDLQKAEAQARESQIQLALERVRARTMAMQRSDELADAAQLLFQQVKELGIPTWTSGFQLWDEDHKAVTVWTSTEGALLPPFKVLVTEDPLNIHIAEAAEKGESLYVEEMSGDALAAHYKYMFSLPSVQEIFGKVAVEGHTPPTFQVNHAAFFTSGFLLIITHEPVPEMWETFKRFAKVFEQTYIRFLDLQRAEAQAREAQIEASLERVRSRSMGMQKSDELKEVIQIVYEQFVHLNIKIEHTGFVIDYKARNDYNIWIADPLGVPSQIIVPYFDSVYYNRFNEAKEKGEDFFATNLNFEEKNRFYEKLFEYIPGLPEEARKFYFGCPALSASTVLLDNVCLYIENFSGIPYNDEENASLMRFGKVFQQTYTRFLDLQRAEAQALEAIKRASVDRLRAEIASMRTTKDLERIQPLIWNELTTLSIPFIRCGVFIMDEEQQLVHTFLSTPEGKAIATLHVPFQFDLSIITNGVSHWRSKKMYKEYWNAAAFTRSWIALSSLRETPVNSNQQEQPPENLYLHMLPFVQGMLYVGNDTPLNEVELQLVQNLAEAFATAYARYEDFNKLEAAKKQVDSTLNELQATQKQLIQSEKMASLGELTAGIAHEIQNPLNFVNNFSEVSKELIEELETERSKVKSERDETMEIDILNDIKQNLEKINHHGKRADAIVKGMLQHSRSTGNVKEPTDINALADEYLRLAYHGLRGKDKLFNAGMKTDFDEGIGYINIIPQDIGRVLLNLYNNAFYAVAEKKKQQPEGYEPTVSINTKKVNDKPDSYRVEIRIADNGNGISQKIVDKIFQPFFTTKPTGQGTGLGLSLAYDIIKAHGGEIKVDTKEGEGAEFTIVLPSGKN